MRYIFLFLVSIDRLIDLLRPSFAEGYPHWFFDWWDGLLEEAGERFYPDYDG